MTDNPTYQRPSIIFTTTAPRSWWRDIAYLLALAVVSGLIGFVAVHTYSVGRTYDPPCYPWGQNYGCKTHYCANQPPPCTTTTTKEPHATFAA